MKYETVVLPVGDASADMPVGDVAAALPVLSEGKLQIVILVSDLVH